MADKNNTDTQRNPVPIEMFGKDHWSTFAYIETRIVDHKGVPVRDHMRTDVDRHPGLLGDTQSMHGIGTRPGDKKYPTRLKGGVDLKDHDDWDCVDDLAKAGLLEIHGTGINPMYKMTELGWKVAHQLRTFKADGGTFAKFEAKLD